MEEKAKIFRDTDADLSVLANRVIAIVGYGNQGRSQALNLRDQGVKVVVGSPSDRSAAQAKEDGFGVFTIAEACKKADIVFLLVPDEVLPEVYRDQVAPHLKKRDVLVFASGYNVFFKTIEIAAGIDVVLLAPRMIGKGVRDTYLSGEGYPALIAVERDESGSALPTLLALSKGVGATKMGAVVSSFREETLCDLFTEHTSMVATFRIMFDALVAAGVRPEVAILELYASGELVEVFSAVRDSGLHAQLQLHSRTSQYGQIVVADRNLDAVRLRKSYDMTLQHIANGDFHREWTKVQSGDKKGFREQLDSVLSSGLQEAEDALYAGLGRRSTHVKNWL